MVSMVTSGSLGGEMVSTPAQNASNVDSIPTLGTTFHHTHDTGAMTRILYKLCTVWLVGKGIVCMYVNCKH